MLLCCFVRKGGRGPGERENGSARGIPGRGKREERPYFVRLAGQICGSVVMAVSVDELNDFDCAFKELSLRGK